MFSARRKACSTSLRQKISSSTCLKDAVFLFPSSLSLTSQDFKLKAGKSQCTHLFELAADWLQGCALAGSSDHSSTAGTLVSPMPFPEACFGGALELRVQVPVWRGRCRRYHQSLQCCHFRLQHVNLGGQETKEESTTSPPTLTHFLIPHRKQTS